MITPSSIYWITRCDSICGTAMLFAIVLGIISAVVLVFFVIVHGTDCEEDNNGINKLCGFVNKLLAAVLVPFLLACAILVAVPTTKEMAAIYVIPAVANNEQLQGLGQDIVDLAKTWVAELMPKKESEAK